MQKEEDIHANYFVHSSMDFFVVLWFQTPMKNLDCFCKRFIILLLIVPVHIHILHKSFSLVVFLKSYKSMKYEYPMMK